jgi:hypothetical protein
MRLLAGRIVVLLCCLSSAELLAGPRDAFLRQHCIDCHGPFAQEAGLRVDQLPEKLADPDHLARWVRLWDRVAAGEMPPSDAEQPSAAERQAFVTSLQQDLLEADRKLLADDGARGVRRMNRTEYENTLRDLLGIPTLSVKEMLPEDGRRHGFDKVPDALELSHIQLSRYLDASNKALRQAVVRQTEPPARLLWRESAADQGTGRGAIAIHQAAPLLDGMLAPGLTTVVRGDPENDPGNTYRAANFEGQADALVVLSSRLGAHQPQGIQPDRFKVPVGGWYDVRFSLWSLRWNRGGNVQPALPGVIRNYTEYESPWVRDAEQRWKGTALEKPSVREIVEETDLPAGQPEVHVVRVSLHGVVLGYFDAPSMEPTEHAVRVWLEPGDKVSFHVMSLPTNGPQNTALANGVRSYEGPGVAFDYFEIEGPLADQWPPPSQRRLFGATPIKAYPRPLDKELPTVRPDQSVTVAGNSLSGAGTASGELWYLNIHGEATARLNVAEPGTYEFAVTAAETPAGNEAAQMELKLNGRPVPHARFRVKAPRETPQVYAQKFTVSSGGPVDIGVEFLNDYLDEQTKADRNLLISQIKITWISPAEQADETSFPSIDALLLDFANTAYRRPVAPEEVEPLVELVHEQLRRGLSFEDAMLAGYQAALCSPDFLFLGLEGGQHALASRLSYFLWGSMPDEHLRKLASEGKLAEPSVLLGEVDRLLNDSRSDRFVEHFLDHWLELRNIDFTTPDGQLYPEYDSWLRDSMLAETRAYFRKLIAENRGVDHLIASDFVLIDQRLARQYDIPGVQGGKLREVPVPEGTPRGGLLSQSSVLKVTANGTATSPVLRGVWVAERILGVTIPPPPPNIPAIEPDASGAETIRDQLEKHRADSACASCHRVMDPPGFALESFDVIGGFREQYRASGPPRKIKVPGEKKMVLEPSLAVSNGYGGIRRIRLAGEVDPAGQMPSGDTFENFRDFQKLLLKDERRLARNLARQLTVYATGRGYRFSDRETIESVVAHAEDSGYGIRSLIDSVILSPLFSTSK